MTQTTPTPDVAAETSEPLLRTVDLTRHFRLGGFSSSRVLHAVDDFNLSIQEREIVALVGESGSGKTTVARLLAMIYPPTRGQIYYRSRPINRLRSRREMLWYRGEVPIVFQDPYSSMNPVLRVSHPVTRQLKLHRPELSKAQRREETYRVFEAVGLTPAADMLQKFPHEMSGGQRQRVGFAQALAAKPKLIVADEPVSMLDVSIRAGLLNMMATLREEQGLSILYITHDLASARYVADRIIVMYAGHLVEVGPTETVLSRPKHPYTQLLLSAVPSLNEKAPEVAADTGEPPKVINPAPGCRFRSRCPYAIEQCGKETPPLRSMGQDRAAACYVAVPDNDEAQDLIISTDGSAAAERPLLANSDGEG
jgi:oligopeptide/dipeptide ABC transporter ATP-binding protein